MGVEQIGFTIPADATDSEVRAELVKMKNGGDDGESDDRWNTVAGLKFTNKVFEDESEADDWVEERADTYGPALVVRVKINGVWQRVVSALVRA